MSLDDAFFLLLLQEEEERHVPMRSFLTLQEKRNRSGKIRRGSLMTPMISPFMHLYNARQDDALITMTGFNFAAFESLLEFFAPLFKQLTPHVPSGCNIQRVRRMRKGRKRLISPILCLGLILVYTRTQGAMKSLQMLFGLTASKLSLWLRYGRRILLYVLNRIPESKITMPTVQEAHYLSQFIQRKYPSLSGAWGVMDGLKIPVQEPWDDIEQSYYYNSWVHGHFISNLFVFSPDGYIRAAYINCPGSYHDSAMAHRGSVYDKIHNLPV